MATHRYLGALLIIVGGINATIVSSALGQDDVDSARAHFSKGMRLYEVGEYRQALGEFRDGHVAKADPAFLYNVAQCHRQLGELDQALVMYKRYLAASPNAANRSEVERRIADLEAQIAEERRAPTREGPGFNAAGTLPPPSAVTPQPATAIDVSAIASPGASSTVSAGAEPAGSSLRYLRWVGAGVTLALAGGAVAAGISTSSKYDELKNSCGKTPAGCDSHEIDGVKTRALITNLLLGAAGVSAVGTGVLFYVTPQEATAQVAWSF